MCAGINNGQWNENLQNQMQIGWNTLDKEMVKLNLFRCPADKIPVHSLVDHLYWPQLAVISVNNLQRPKYFTLPVNTPNSESHISEFTKL